MGSASPSQGSHYALQDIRETHGRLVARELLRQVDPFTAPAGPLQLVQALLEAAPTVGPRLPLFITLDKVELLSPVVEVLSAPLGVVQLPPGLRISAAMVRRIERLGRQGHVFALGAISRADDPRWAMARLVRYLMLDMVRLPRAQREPLVERAQQHQLVVVAQGVRTAEEHCHMQSLGVTRFQGSYCQAPAVHAATPLPGCDPVLLRRLERLMLFGVSCGLLASVAAADAPLVQRLERLHTLYRPDGGERPASLDALLSGIPYSALQGWMALLTESARPGHASEYTLAP